MQINKISFNQYKNSQNNSKSSPREVPFGWFSLYPKVVKARTKELKIQRRFTRNNESNLWLRTMTKHFITAQQRYEKQMHKELVKTIKNILLETTDVRHVKDVEHIFDFLGIRTQKMDNGKLILEKYKQPDSNFTFKELGIDENKMFNFVEKIYGDADFSNSEVTNLGKLKAIGGDVTIKNSKLTPDSFKNITVRGEIKT